MGAQNIVSQRKNDIEVFVGMSVVQQVVSSQKLIDGPVFEVFVLGLMHFEVDLIPQPMVKIDSPYKN